MTPPRLARALRWALGLALSLVVLGIVGHFVVRAISRRDPPEVTPVTDALTERDGIRRVGRSSARRVGGLLEVRLEGSPEQIGHAHTVLLYPDMLETERVVWDLLSTHVPNRLARVLLLDVAQFGYRNVADGFSDPRRREIAAAARAFSPDPYADQFPTYQRFVYLNALYDISLAFEHSPLIGCTTFTFTGPSAVDGHPLLARAFDFDVHDVFDEKKAVFLVREDGQIPFASVAWPGLAGVVSGMNAEGVAVVVHGARAGPTKDVGEPVVHALRRVLSRARDTEQALAELERGVPMVSHLVIVLDAAGRGAVAERVPDREMFVRPLEGARAVTNHLEGPSAADPKNQRVREQTTTLARERRGEELARSVTAPVDAAHAVSFLRDRRAAGGGPLPLGDRRAIDALIATHGVVMDTGARVLWVSEAPHLLGRFVAFDLPRLLAPDFDPAQDQRERRSIPADELAARRRGREVP